MAVPRIDDFDGDAPNNPFAPRTALPSYSAKRGKVFNAPRPVWGMRGASESLAVEPSQTTGKMLDLEAGKRVLDESLGN